MIRPAARNGAAGTNKTNNDNGEVLMARLSSCLAAALLSAVASHALAQITDFKPVTEEVLANPDPADWLMISRTFDQHRFSPLNQINKSNVGQMRMAWTRGLPAGTQEVDAGRLSRRHVHERARRQRAGDQRDQRRPDLGIRARLSEERQSAARRATRISASSRT